MDFKSVRESITEKLGEENSGVIADDFANMMTLEKEFNDEMENLKKENEKLKDHNEKLISANANLLMKVGTEVVPPKKKEVEEDEKPFNFASVFDEKGNFKK